MTPRPLARKLIDALSPNWPNADKTRYTRMVIKSVHDHQDQWVLTSYTPTLRRVIKRSRRHIDFAYPPNVCDVRYNHNDMRTPKSELDYAWRARKASYTDAFNRFVSTMIKLSTIMLNRLIAYADRARSHYVNALSANDTQAARDWMSELQRLENAMSVVVSHNTSTLAQPWDQIVRAYTSSAQLSPYEKYEISQLLDTREVYDAWSDFSAQHQALHSEALERGTKVGIASLDIDAIYVVKPKVTLGKLTSTNLNKLSPLTPAEGSLWYYLDGAWRSYSLPVALYPTQLAQAIRSGYMTKKSSTRHENLPTYCGEGWPKDVDDAIKYGYDAGTRGLDPTLYYSQLKHTCSNNENLDYRELSSLYASAYQWGEAKRFAPSPRTNPRTYQWELITPSDYDYAQNYER